MASDAAIPGGQAGERVRVPFPLQDDERTLLLVRRHWIFLWPRTLLYLLFGIVPVIALAVLLNAIDQYDGVLVKIFWVVSALWALYWTVRILLNWYRYHNDIWVITNQRIVDSIKTTPFNHRLSTADLVNVQDMTVERNGVLRTLLNYGDIVCQTAAASGSDFVLSGIPRPEEVQLLVDRERDRERRRP